MQSLTVNRELLNSKFEGYKLELIPQEHAVLRYDLPYKPTQATVSTKTPLTFQEVQSRITHNHLALSNETSQAVYVDSLNRVILIDLADPPTFRVIYELPETISSDLRPEYPSAIFFRSDLILVADGHGLLHVLKLEQSDIATGLGVFATSTPFRIHSLHRDKPDVGTVIVSSRSYGLGEVHFDVSGIKVDLSTLRQNDVSPLQVIWQRKGKEVPIYASFVPTLNAFLLIGGSVYREEELPEPEPFPDEYAPIPKANENLDAEIQDPPRPQPYSWSQTSDSITVAFPLPSNTPKSKINVLFSPKTLTLHVDSQSSVDPRIPMPRYSAKLLWDTISPSTSIWTWDREAEHSFGLLTLHLDKTNTGTRWIQVFARAATATSTDSSPEDLEVPEALDPSELWHIREALEKYTEALRTGQDTGLGTGVPSLGRGEIDDEVDETVGREAYQTWLTLDGHVPDWWKNARQSPFTLLSTPLPGTSRSDSTLVIKSHIDGALLSPTGPANSPKWEHISSFSALAFVLASKRDTRFTHHTDDAVFAFESGAKDRGGNVYIYRAAPLSSTWAKQAVLKVDDGQGGSLLGVGAWNANGGKSLVLVCLTEGELVLIKPS